MFLSVGPVAAAERSFVHRQPTSRNITDLNTLTAADIDEFEHGGVGFTIDGVGGGGGGGGDGLETERDGDTADGGGDGGGVTEREDRGSSGGGGDGHEERGGTKDLSSSIPQRLLSETVPEFLASLSTGERSETNAVAAVNAGGAALLASLRRLSSLAAVRPRSECVARNRVIQNCVSDSSAYSRTRQ